MLPIPQTIKGQTVFIPDDYLVYEHNINKPRDPKYHEHVNATPPTIKYIEYDGEGNKLGKWCLTFESADSGGYDVQTFYYYFNLWDDLLDFLMKED